MFGNITYGMAVAEEPVAPTAGVVVLAPARTAVLALEASRPVFCKPRSSSMRLPIRLRQEQRQMLSPQQTSLVYEIDLI